MDEADIENLNVTMADGKVTWRTRENESAIDFVLANEGARRNIKKMVIDEDGEWDVNTNSDVHRCTKYAKAIPIQRYMKIT